jgi:hypothetical protein
MAWLRGFGGRDAAAGLRDQALVLHFHDTRVLGTALDRPPLEVGIRQFDTGVGIIG